MLAIFSLISGFVSPWIGDLLGLFKAKQSNAHELEMLRESNKSAREIAVLNAQVGMAQAEVEDIKSARDAVPSYGMRLLDTVAGDDSLLCRYFVKPLLVLVLAAVEVLNALMRPYAIYTILTLWASTKVARFYFAYHAVLGGGVTPEAQLAAMASAVLAIWDDHDWVAMDYVLGFLLGSRHKLKEGGVK